MQVMVEVPSQLGKSLEQFRDRLPEVLARGVKELQAEQRTTFHDEAEIMAVLTTQPTPEQVLAIRPSPEFQARVSELLMRSKQHQLSTLEERELERYLTLEHLVRLAKAQAHKQLSRAA